MKLSKQTIELLHWCSLIQDSLLIQPGNEIRTISTSKAIYFDAKVSEYFPTQFGVWHLKSFLDCIDQNTDISFEDPSCVGLRNGRILTKVRGVNEALILKPPSKRPTVATFDESLFLHSDDVYELRRLKGDKTVVEFHASNPCTPIRIDFFEAGPPLEPVPIRQTMEPVKRQLSSQQFRSRFKLKNLKLFEGSYRVDLAAAGMARFSWLNGNVIVCVAIEGAHSHFGTPPPIKPIKPVETKDGPNCSLVASTVPRLTSAI